MVLTQKNLELNFDQAKKHNYEYVGVAIQLPDTDGIEIIINGSKNFDYKLNYYKNTYNEDLSHKHVPNLKIVGFTYGDSFSQIEEDLIDHL